MHYFHESRDVDINLIDAIKRHSADECKIYKYVDGEPIYLGYYFPENYDSAKRHALFVFIHGGGWATHHTFNDQSHWMGDFLGYLARYYAEKGFVCVSIDYRLLQDLGQKQGYQLSDLYQDCVDAIDYVLDHAVEYGIDTKQVSVLGESAGGHLAGLVATKYERKGFEFKRAFLVNAITELLDDKEWSMRVPKRMQQDILAVQMAKECAKSLSPLWNISDNTCPVILIHGEQDHVVNPKHSELFYQRMQTFHRECALHWIVDTDHAFLLAEYTSNQNACRLGIEIIDGYLEERYEEF